MYLKDITAIMKCANKTAKNLAQEHRWKPQGRGGYAVSREEVLRVAALPRASYGNQKDPNTVPSFGSLALIEAWPIKAKEN